MAEGTATVAVPTQSVAYAEVAPPRVELRRGDLRPPLQSLRGDLAGRLRRRAPVHRDSLLGPLQAARRGLIDPVLVGPEDKIRSVAQAEGVDLGSYRIISTAHSHESAARAVELARAGEVDALMKGSLHTDELMGAVVPSATGLRTSRRISHVFVMDVPTYSRTLLVTDAAINIAPGSKEKVDIAQNAIDLAHVLGVTEPKMAILAAVEVVNPEMPSTLEAAALCKMADRGQISGGVSTVPWPSTTRSVSRLPGRRRSPPRWPGRPTSCSCPTSRRATSLPSNSFTSRVLKGPASSWAPGSRSC